MDGQKKGWQVVDLASHGHWCTTTTISSIRLNGSTTGDIFRAYAEHVLVPSLRPGDIVVLDNLASHKDQVALEMIRQAGAEVRFLPPYSPDLNPIEKMWSKIKQILRSVKARTQEALLAAIAAALECVNEEDALGWFSSCGYGSI
jgi:transposase